MDKARLQHLQDLADKKRDERGYHDGAPCCGTCADLGQDMEGLFCLTTYQQGDSVAIYASVTKFGLCSKHTPKKG